jgi:hypothetical protein
MVYTMDVTFKRNMSPILEGLTKILAMGRRTINERDLTSLSHFHDEAVDLSDKVQEMATLLKNIANECNDTMFEIREQQVCDDTQFNFVYKQKGKLMWGRVEELEVQPEHKEESHKQVTAVCGVRIPSIQLPVAAALDSIPQAMYWYGGNRRHEAGVYMRVAPNLVVKVPFPNTFDSAGELSRIGSIRCKYSDLVTCANMRQAIADKYRSTARKCTFAHTGMRYRKVGMNHRAQGMPWFGNHETFCNDVGSVALEDVKTILMYSMSDLLLCRVWGEHNEVSAVYTDVDVVQ